jgi:DNA repair protein SbcD/Mre11
MSAAFLRVLLASDFHIGMKFAGYPDNVRSALADARFTSLQRVAAAAAERRAGLLVIAGDLFHSVSASKRDVERAGEALRDLTDTVCAVLPGNHDYLAPGDELWRRFRDAAGESVLLLDRPEPFPLSPLGIPACLYPGPCVAKHSPQNAVGWVKTAPREPAGFRIGVAHGSLEGVSPDFARSYYPMTPAELLSLGLDLWLVGHTHVHFPERPGKEDRIFNAGTPEPDGMDCRHAGSAWLIELAEAGVTSAELLETGSNLFSDLEAEVRSAEDLQGLEKRLTGPGAERTLLRLCLRGRLSREGLTGLPAMQERLRMALMHLEWDDSGVGEEITPELIDVEFSAGSFPHRLLAQIAALDDAEALRMAYEMLQEARR